MKPKVRLLTGDIRKAINKDVDNIACVVTSPPYYKLRDYQHPKQLGQEKTIQQYVDNLVEVFGMVRDKMDDTGTLFINLGDRYINGKLVGAPWHLAIALIEDGWILKNDIIWNRNRIMPESVKNRFTKSHEYLFFFAKKSRGYTFNADAVREVAKWAHDRRAGKGRHVYGEARGDSAHTAAVYIAKDGKRNRRTVWTIETSQTDGGHSATFPCELPEICILAGSNPGDVVFDPFLGTGTTGIAAVRHNRSFIGIDVVSKFVSQARKRITSEMKS